jgi:hypothetical protein
MFWLVLLLFIATTVIGELLKPKGQKPTAGALGDFNFPTAQEGRAIPYVCGTVKIGGGNTVWWGDLKVVPLKKRASFMSFSSQIVGYKYYIGVQYALCWGGPELVLISINANKKNLPYTAAVVNNGNGSEDRIVLDVEGDRLFGGTNVGGEGGFSGTMDFYRGLTSQQPNDYLTAKQGRVPVDQSTGLGYTYAGVGNGTLAFLSGGGSALNEVITMTATGYSFSRGAEAFSIDGSISGHIGTAYATIPFSSSRINGTISTGTIPYATGDRFTVNLVHSHAAPAYKRICYAVMEQMYVGTTANPKPLEFIIRRCPDPFGQGAGVANIGGDANGVLAIYELMTDLYFGLGITPSKFDAASFQAAAAMIAGEGLGISFQQDSLETADSIIGEILRHLDGVIYTDPATGLWTIKLARGDYDPAAIPVLDTSSIESIDYARGSWAETTNHVIVKYLSRAANFNERTVQSYDAANISVTREVRSETIDFKFISNRLTASLIAMRALKTLTYPMGKLKVIANRKAWNYRMGGVFKVNWTPLGIVGMIFRITHIGYGEVSSGKITIDAVEDIFGITNTAFVSPPDSGWVNPLGAPGAPAQQRLIEAPYAFLVEGALPLGRYALPLAARGDATSKSFEVWNVETTPIESVPLADFCPIGTLTAAYGTTAAFDAAGFTIQNLLDTTDLVSISDTDFAIGKLLCLIDDEILAVQTIVQGGGTITVSNVIRGVLDTVPAAHAMGAVVWFISQGLVSTRSSPIPADATMQSKLLPENNEGVYPIASATTLSLVTRSRYLAPYPPGNLRIGLLAWGVIPSTVTGDLVITWSARNRLTQATMIRQDAGDVTGGGEVGQTYSVVVKIAGVTVHTYTGLGAGFTYTAAARGIDDPDFTKPVTIEIRSNANGLDSYFAQAFTTVMSGATGALGPGRYEFGATHIGGMLL